MPTNLYGPGDNFHSVNSHVVPALIKRFHAAKNDGQSEISIWGSGTPMREFLHVDDMAAASLFVLDMDPELYQQNTQPMLSHINVGSGSEVSIRDLALLIRDVVGYEGALTFDVSQPDGSPRKLMDSSRLENMGWKAGIGLRKGLVDAYGWYLESLDTVRN